ncbi:response regulator [Bacillus sp. FJAT-49736]|uniref:response regulator n=1 Tax=Bacillus sp. FJAT-49736 TaxID=2833582 RepID=UPI001BC8F240|nr:response regulator [Bacillus sp. FJAT-49736]MBS4174275.1 response regulator [Bacillus sp. FJAT-49736]
MMLKAILVDDEVLANTLLENLLLDVGGIEIIGKSTNPDEALMLVSDLMPDIVFLDIEMPNKNGLQVANQIKQHHEQIEIVFVTAYNQYALEAFDIYASGYLLKPIEKGRLEKTVSLLERRKKGNSGVKKEPTKTLKAQLMGDFVLFDLEGEPIKWRTKKVKELCAYLLHHQHPVHRTKLMEDLWPDTSLDKVSTHIHSSIYQLRKELKKHGFSDAIIYRDERYSIKLELECDFFNLQTMLGQSVQPEEQIHQMIEWYKNDYLVHEGYTWALSQSEKIKNQFKRMLEDWIVNIGQVQNDFKRIVLEKLIELDPLDEAYSKELMKYYVSDGNVQKALEIYKQLEKVLWEELEVRPKDETEKVLQALL